MYCFGPSVHPSFLSLVLVMLNNIHTLHQAKLKAAESKGSQLDAIKNQVMHKCKRCMQTFATTSKKAELESHCENKHAEYNFDFCFAADFDSNIAKAKAASEGKK